MESGTILHLALLRKISNLSSNPNYREKLYQPKKLKIVTQSDLSHPSLWSCKKETPFPLIEISNRQLNSTSKQKNKTGKRVFYQEEGSTISGWSIHAAEQNIQNQDCIKLIKNTKKYEEKQKIITPSKFSTLKRKNHLFSYNIKKDNSINAIIIDGQQLHKRKNNFNLKDPYYRRKYSLIKQVNLSYLPEFQTLKRQQKTQTCLELGQKLKSFQAFVSQLKLKQNTRK